MSSDCYSANLHDVRQLSPSWRERYHWQPHCHINYFTAHHLRDLFARVGFEMKFFAPQLPLVVADWPTLIRATMDGVGIHSFGLNCYAIKS